MSIKSSKKLCKGMIVRFSTFTHRTKFYRSRYTIFTKAIETGKQSNVVDYIMVDINCRLKVVFKHGLSKIFTDFDSLKRAIEEEEIN